MVTMDGSQRSTKPQKLKNFMLICILSWKGLIALHSDLKEFYNEKNQLRNAFPKSELRLLFVPSLKSSQSYILLKQKTLIVTSTPVFAKVCFAEHNIYRRFCHRIFPKPNKFGKYYMLYFLEIYNV